ncbi:MAG: metallophosphoesterase [Candidatus Altiarchaeota archaeon]|nr:metallophosphoesterase [Candidatus Altiarchaeota archaeon]
MKILCIADIHGDEDSVREIRDFVKNSGMDLVVILGDFPGYGVFRDRELSMEGVNSILDIIQDLNLLAIPGNCDHPKILDLFNELGINLHEKVKELKGVKMVGFGGSNTTPFNSPFEMSEEEIYSRLRDLMESVKDDRVILALHCPPGDTNCDMTGEGAHVGSSSIRRIIEEFQPTLAVCSHIHEAGGSLDWIGETQVANIGMLSQGNTGIIEIDDGIKIELRGLK